MNVTYVPYNRGDNFRKIEGALYTFQFLKSADATAIEAINKMRSAVVTFGNASSNLLLRV